ncbi:HET domain-containing protein [Colletotrichum fioriniae PJ7]|uniref:HET domain-containing protein n=1 Tax=Colletotrichum fioriniae PJ7 TaxID=1445577 RepID=A0A010Q4B4_9PEZI|nr:HET domain-containing protein [Colletotrichum fioriniae PJ7]
MGSNNIVPYQYSPLRSPDSIRIVILDPAPDAQSPLRCSLAQYDKVEQMKNFGTKKDFEAVSYTWGDAPPSCQLMIEGAFSFDISPTVDSLLRALRQPSTTRSLWIDAICLNQQDAGEKAQQLPRMGRIYKGTKEVHIWLGDPDDKTAAIFSAIRMMQMIPDTKQVKVMADATLKITENQLGADHILHLKRFLSRPWFSRRWIIQEACLAKEAKVHCGISSLGLPWFVAAARRLECVKELYAFQYHYQILMMKSLSEERKPILQLLWNFHAAKCREPEDRIAALFGLIPDHEQIMDQQSYLDLRQHWSVLYRRLALAMFQRGQKTALQMLLHLAEFGPLRESDDCYPSWVPNWTTERRRNLPFYNLSSNVDAFDYPEKPGFPEIAVVMDLESASTFALPPVNPIGDEWVVQEIPGKTPNWTDERTTRFLFKQDRIFIRWYDSSGGPRGRTVDSFMFADAPDEYPESFSPLHDLAILWRDFFPSNFPYAEGDSERIETIAMLFWNMLRFRNPSKIPPEQRFIGNTLKYLCKLQRHQLTSDQAKLIDQIYTMMEENAFFSLEPRDLPEDLSPSFRSRGEYGFGPRTLFPGDIMIPVWRLQEDPARRSCIMRHDETRRHMATMLVLRIERGPEDTQYSPIPFSAPIDPATGIPVEAPHIRWMKYPKRSKPYPVAGPKESALESTAEPGQHGMVRKPVRRGRVIGMAVCVTSDGTKRYAEHDIRLHEEMHKDLDVDQPCLIELY